MCSMLLTALDARRRAQAYTVWKQWRRWLLVVGPRGRQALRRRCDAQRPAWRQDRRKRVRRHRGARRTDSSVTLIRRQMPVFTQSAPAYDISSPPTAKYSLPSALPTGPEPDRQLGRSSTDQLGRGARPVGAIQIQNRFIKLNSRRMTARDMSLDRGAHDRRSRGPNRRPK